MLAIGFYSKVVFLGELINCSPDTIFLRPVEVIVSEHDATGLQQLPSSVDIFPCRMKTVSGVDLHQISVDPAKTQRVQSRAGREGHRYDPPFLPGIHHVLHELLHQNYVAVDVDDVSEHPLVVSSEPRPPTEVIHAQDDRVIQTQPSRYVRHVESRVPQESTHLDDDSWIRKSDHFLEHRIRRPPAVNLVVLEIGTEVRRREVCVRGFVVEQFEHSWEDARIRNRWGAFRREPVEIFITDDRRKKRRR